MYRMDFWPLKELGLDAAFRDVPSSRKHVRYSDGTWSYVADSINGIDIEVRCKCGEVHKIHLGANLYCEPPITDSEVVDAEVIEEDGGNDESDGVVGGDPRTRNLPYVQQTNGIEGTG
jgi:hypothetical protein